MTKQEARDELKETEGRPEVRSRIRSLQRALATRRMMADVPKADVVAMNPTHYAVALRYDAGKMKAPRVVAKGADLIAFQIRRVAEAHNVPIFEHPQFARALYHTSEIGKEISPRLVRRRRASAHLHLSADGPHAGAERAARGPGQRPAEDAGARRSMPTRPSRARGPRARS